MSTTTFDTSRTPMPKKRMDRILWVEPPPPPEQFSFLKRKRNGTLVARNIKKTPCWVPPKNTKFVALVPDEDNAPAAEVLSCKNNPQISDSTEVAGGNLVNDQRKGKQILGVNSKSFNTKGKRQFTDDLTVTAATNAAPLPKRRRKSQLVVLPSLPENPAYHSPDFSRIMQAMAGPIAYSNGVQLPCNGSGDAGAVDAATSDPRGSDNDDGSLIFDFTRLLRSPPRKDAATMNGSATSAKEEETEPQPVPKPEPQPQTEHQPDTETVIPSWKDMYMGGDATDGGCGDVGVSSSMLEEIWETSQLERQRADDDESREEDQLLLLHALTSELGSPPQGQDTAVPELLDESNRTGSSASSGRSDVGSPPIAVVEAMDESMATAVMKWSDDMLTPAVFEESDDEIGDDCEESEGAESSIELDFDRIDDGFDETFLISLPRLGELELFGNPVADPRNDCEEYDVTAERILSLPWSEATGHHHHHPTINHQHFNVFPTPTATLPSSQPSTPPRNPTFSTLPPTQIQAQTVTNLFATPLPNQMTPPPTFVTSFHAPSQITWSSPCWKASALTVLHGDVVSDTPASSLSMGRKRVNEAFLLEAPQSSPEGLLGILQQCQGGEEVGCVVSADVSPCGSVMSFGGGSVGMGFVGEEDWLVGV